MKYNIYQVDAFAEKLFGGNPAAVVPLEHWLPDAVLQQIAAENNLAETAFFVKTNEAYHLRWFTPENEINLCGHATVATAFVMYQFLSYAGEEIIFESKSGKLTVHRKEDLFILNFPAYQISPVEVTNDILAAVGKTPTEAFQMNNDLMLVYHDEPSVKMLNPDFGKMKQCVPRAILVTGP